MAETGREASRLLAQAWPGQGARGQEPRRIVLVEDDEGDAVLVSELLRESWPWLELDRVRTLSEAEDRLRERADCVLLDMNLPDIVGIGAVRRVREIDGELPIVVLTGNTNELRGIEALGAGAQDYIVKRTMSGSGLARAIRHSVQRKLAERFARELALLRAQSAENARVQRGLMARPLIQDGRLMVSSAYRPGNRRQVLGGDFFDVVQSSPDRVDVMLGDVCGHGPDEAALGVQLRIAWRTLVFAGVEQQPMLETLHRLLLQERHSEHLFATLATINVDLTRSAARVALAGHPPPILLESAGPRMLTGELGGQPLGLAAPATWQLVDVALPVGWSLLLYSDGIYEGRVSGAEGRLEIDGLIGVLADTEPAGYGGDRPVIDPGRLIDRVEELNGGPLDDDVAVLAVRFDA